MLYFIFRPIVRVALWFFYGHFKVSGLENLPRNAPVILAPNHQNSFLDAILPACFQPRSLHFLTRSDVFKKGLIQKILFGFHMWPVYRQRDGKDTLGKNEEVFKNCSQLLRSNGCLLLFPEGDQICAHNLRSLKKGMARIAFQTAEESNFEKEIYIVPVGLNYEHYWNFNTAFQMRFGKPIKVLDFKKDYQESEQKGLLSLTKAVSEGMEQEIIQIGSRANEHFWFEEAGLSGVELTSPEFFRNIDVDSRPAPKPKKRKINALARALHWPVLTLLASFLKSKIKDNKFLGAVKFGMGMVFFPIYYLILFTAAVALSGSWWLGAGLIVFMILSLKIKS
ncbi:1-acyl-sn-glycerol-3-phosphate acyltransferase [uncultured Imperialibacter sp.]|uniref:1-acyl-sn-glycerol-3-phosphate acyltransferase n=1 Tax=uncultured Imperialibacter sp. TaxID=1672639 RepID=UPI0030D83305|tara:strand:- start:356 stop:1366 length:1011 start_codon:yes stop_codon:yes gene_type:complete